MYLEYYTEIKTAHTLLLIPVKGLKSNLILFNSDFN